MKFGYADPPYPGLARKYYGCDEVDHAKLVVWMLRSFPDGWALSTSAEALESVLAIVRGALKRRRLSAKWLRVCVCLKRSRHGASYYARNAWEPLIVYGGRPLALTPAEVLDDVLLDTGRGQKSHPDALVGMKSAAFAEWMFRMLGAQRGDELVDVFPGSGVIGRAWQLYVSPAAAATRRTSTRLPSRLSEAQANLRQKLEGAA